MDYKSMPDLNPTEQAKKAIQHILIRIRDDSNIGWYMGLGTAAFTMLTEAAASLYGEPIEKVREAFLPRDPKDPRKREDEV
jgi:hypothetical protein